MVLYQTGCDHCGGIDDHPKIHYGDETYHHDCAPAKVRLDIEDHPIAPKIIAAAESGIRGDALRQYIADLHKDY